MDNTHTSDKADFNGKPAETAVEHLIQAIREEVRNGRFAQGQRLVVADLSRTFGVSVGPVREAIRRLTGEGLLGFTPHRGAVVRVFTERDVREAFQVREALEGYVARLAAENIHRSDYADRLTRFQRELQAIVPTDSDTLSNTRQRFHDLLYEFAGNAMLQESAERLTYPVFRRQFNERTGAERARQSLREHNDIIAAILSGHGVRAESLMRLHLRNGAAAVCIALDELRTLEANSSDAEAV